MTLARAAREANMPIGEQVTIASHTGNGVATVFAYSFGVLAADDLKVLVNGVEVTTGFTVSGIGSRTGGTVTFSTAPTSGAAILIVREVVRKRDTDYQYSGDLREEVVDDDLDRIWMTLQEDGELVDRGVRVPVGETLSELPVAASRVDKVLTFGAGGGIALVDIAAFSGGGVVELVPADGSIALVKLTTAVQNLINGALQSDGSVSLLANATTALQPVPLRQLGTVSAQCRTGFLMTASGSDATVVVSAKELLLRDASGNPKLVSGASGTINLSGTIGQPLAISTGSWSADTWYAVWAWNNGTTTTFTADPSSSSPTAPAGYTSGYRQFLGGFRTDSTVNKRPLAFFDDGETCRYVVGTNLAGLPQMASGTAGSISTPTWVSVAWANFAPPWAKEIHVTAHQLASSGSVVMVASSNAFGAYTSATNPPPQVCAGGASVETVTTMEHPLESSNIYWASAGASGNGIFCRGWRSSL